MEKISNIKQQGFTIVELLITILLGILISAAVIQVFVTSQRVDRLQNSGSEIQDKSIFGMQSLEKQVRHANLGNDGVEIDMYTRKAGVVLTSVSYTDYTKVPKLPLAERLANVITDTALEDGYLSRSEDMTTSGSDGWTGISNMTDSTGSIDAKSDQLTIQYVNVVEDMPMFDCEGTQVALNDRVIERYYLKKEADQSINLLCDAGRIVPLSADEDPDQQIQNFGSTSGNNTAVIMENVDQFNIRLGVARRGEKSKKALLEQGELTVKEFIEEREKPNSKQFYVTNIRLAVLARSTSNSPEGSPDEFTIFGNTQKVKSSSGSGKYMRRLYETNVLLRNARVLDI